MRTKLLCRTALLVLALTSQGHSAPEVESMHGHGDATLLHAIRLETDIGRSRGDTTGTWDLDGWVGGDEEKLWVKSEGEITAGKTEQAELWAMYSRNVADFWDAQLGLRQDFQPYAHSYFTAGINGLAPYFLETEAHVFLRDDGGISARIREEYEMLLTNRLMLRPRAEANLNLTRDRSEQLGTGLTDLQASMQARYEISRAFAPYVEVKYSKKFGDTADEARLQDEATDATSLNVGIRWLF